MKKVVVIGLVCLLLVLVSCAEPANVKKSRSEAVSIAASSPTVDNNSAEVVVADTAVAATATSPLAPSPMC